MGQNRWLDEALSVPAFLKTLVPKLFEFSTEVTFL